jgi:hypothetical protein
MKKGEKRSRKCIHQPPKTQLQMRKVAQERTILGQAVFLLHPKELRTYEKPLTSYLPNDFSHHSKPSGLAIARRGPRNGSEASLPSRDVQAAKLGRLVHRPV